MMRMEAIRRRSIIGEKKANHTVLNYIQSSGAQFISTRYSATQDTKIELTMSYHQANTGAGFLFGSRNATTSGLYGFYVGGTISADSGYIRSDYNTQNTTFGPLADLKIGSKFRVLKNKNVTTIYNSAGDVIGTQSATYSAFTVTQSLLSIFTRNNSSSYCSIFRCYGYKRWDDATGTVLLEDLIPVLKDGVYCMYDNVSGTYYYNQGTGSFTGG